MFLIFLMFLLTGQGMAQTTYPYVFSVTAGAANTGLAANMNIVIKDAEGTTRISIAGSTVSTGTATAIAEETDAAGNAVSGSYSTTLTIDSSWSLPLSYKVTITGKAAFALRGAFLADRADAIADGFTSSLASRVVTGIPNVAPGASGGLPTTDAANGVKVSVGTGTGQINVASGKTPATLSSGDVSGNLPADLQTIKTQTVTASGGVTFPVGTLGTGTSTLTQAQVTGGAYALNTNSSGSVRIVNGAGTGEVALASGQVTVGTNNDKTGYTASTVTDKTGYGLASSERTTLSGVIWDEALPGSHASGSAGYKLNGLSGSGGTDPWAATLSSYTTTGTFGNGLRLFLGSNDSSGRVNVGQWRDSVPNALISGRIDGNTQATASTLTFTHSGNITGDVQGKVLGGGSSSFVANGVQTAGSAGGSDSLANALSTYTTPGTGGYLLSQLASSGFTGSLLNVNTKTMDTAVQNAIAAQILGQVIDGSITLKQAQAIQLAVAAGNYTYTPPSTAGGNSVNRYKRQDGTTVIGTATVTWTSDGKTQTSRTTVFTNLP